MKCPYDIPLKPIYCKISKSWIVEDSNGKVVFADLNISKAKANYIVTAINSHEKLVEQKEKLTLELLAIDHYCRVNDIDIEQALKEAEKP